MNKHPEKRVCKINDPRIEGYTERTRSGQTQIFYTGNDRRDFERYQHERKKNPNAEMHDKKDTIRITPPEKHYYADLIDGEWWWVNGCAECNGNERDWMTYIECDKHDVCAHCGCDRKSLTEAPWGRKAGWVCKPCAAKEHRIEKRAALAAMPKEIDPWKYHGIHEVTCPYCNYKFDDSFEHYDSDCADEECPRCDNIFTVTAVHTVKFDCDRKG